MSQEFNVNLDVDSIMRAIGVDVWHKEREVAFDVLHALVDRTPVDTGRARASWGMNTKSCPNYDVGELKGSKLNEGAAKSVAMSHIGDVRGASPGPILPRIEIANYVEYVGFLNDGSSEQSGAHFVEKALADVERGF